MKIRLIPYFEFPCPTCDTLLQFHPFVHTQHQICSSCNHAIEFEMKKPFFKAFRKVYKNIEDVKNLENRITRTIAKGTPAVWFPQVSLAKEEKTVHKIKERFKEKA